MAVCAQQSWGELGPTQPAAICSRLLCPYYSEGSGPSPAGSHCRSLGLVPASLPVPVLPWASVNAPGAESAVRVLDAESGDTETCPRGGRTPGAKEERKGGLQADRVGVVPVPEPHMSQAELNTGAPWVPSSTPLLAGAPRMPAWAGRWNCPSSRHIHTKQKWVVFLPELLQSSPRWKCLLQAQAGGPCSGSRDPGEQEVGTPSRNRSL